MCVCVSLALSLSDCLSVCVCLSPFLPLTFFQESSICREPDYVLGYNSSTDSWKLRGGERERSVRLVALDTAGDDAVHWKLPPHKPGLRECVSASMCLNRQEPSLCESWPMSPEHESHNEPCISCLGHLCETSIKVFKHHVFLCDSAWRGCEGSLLQTNPYNSRRQLLSDLNVYQKGSVPLHVPFPSQSIGTGYQ